MSADTTPEMLELFKAHLEEGNCHCHDSWDQCPCAEGGHFPGCDCCPLGTGLCGPKPAGIRVRQGDRIRHRWPDGTRQWFTVGNITQHPAGSVAHCDGLTITLDPGGTLPADDIETVPEQIDRFLSGEPT